MNRRSFCSSKNPTLWSPLHTHTKLSHASVPLHMLFPQPGTSFFTFFS